MVKSNCAWAAAASVAWIVPLTVPGGNPTTAVPGATPRSPVTVVAPVLVTVVPPRTAYPAADPRGTGAWAAFASWHRSITVTARTRPVRIRFVAFIPT